MSERLGPGGWLDAHRHPAEIAPDLLGCTLVCRGTAAVIVEVEAYHQDEPAAHSFGGRPTPRTEVMFGPPGTLYVYFTYGMHWCANLVTGPEGSGEAVLFRAGVALAGEELIRARRAAKRGVDPARLKAKELLAGPARLVEGLGMLAADNGRLIVRGDASSVEEALELAGDGPVLVRDIDAAASVGIDIPVGDDLLIGPRIGISKAAELPWRFGVRGSLLSKPFPIGS
ncbi:MAG: DNA-3-methyladenine glycosylase [Thermoleophilia bacterium]|nr:DNA-3-methyladenine glycosylase [Thermoleophilia bacterium]